MPGGLVLRPIGLPRAPISGARDVRRVHVHQAQDRVAEGRGQAARGARHRVHGGVLQGRDDRWPFHGRLGAGGEATVQEGHVRRWRGLHLSRAGGSRHAALDPRRRVRRRPRRPVVPQVWRGEGDMHMHMRMHMHWSHAHALVTCTCAQAWRGEGAEPSPALAP